MDVSVNDGVDLAVQQDLLKSLLSDPVLRAGLASRVPRPVHEGNRPRSLCSIHVLQIVTEPVDLLVGVRAAIACIHSRRAAEVVGRNDTLSQVRLGIQHHVVRHTVIEGIPEVTLTTADVARHRPVVFVPGKIGLSRQTDRFIVRWVSADTNRTSADVDIDVARPLTHSLDHSRRCRSLIRAARFERQTTIKSQLRTIRDGEKAPKDLRCQRQSYTPSPS